MGIRTKHYVPRPSAQQSEQNQPIQEAVQNQGAANSQPTPPTPAASTTGTVTTGAGSSAIKPKAKGKSKSKAKSKPTAEKKQEEVVPPPPPPPVLEKKATVAPKKAAKKRKQKQNGKVQQDKVEKVEKSHVVDNKDILAVAVVAQPTKAVAVQPPTKKAKLEVASADNNKQEASGTNGLKNGIIKANKKMKKGMQIMMERTNKILERSRKKQPRKKSPVKPRILPARASARLCVRKNSGEHELGMHRGDQPLRTVELIRRPLELRDPATKLLYLASLALYPKADPESDTTPIVIISEEIPNPGGKKPKLRSRELPLLPYWRNSCSPSLNHPSRANVMDMDDPVLLSFMPVVSPGITNANQSSAVNNKSSKKKKTSEKKLQAPPAIEVKASKIVEKKAKAAKSRSKAKASSKVANIVVSQQIELKPEEKKIDPITEVKPGEGFENKPSKTNQVSNGINTAFSQQSSFINTNNTPQQPQNEFHTVDKLNTPTVLEIKFPLASGLTISPTKPPFVSSNNPIVPSKFPAVAKAKYSSKLDFLDVGNNLGSSVFPSLSFTSVTVSHFPQQDSQPNKKSENEKANNTTIQPADTVTGNKSEIHAQIQPSAAAPVKRKRKSLETIIKEIPKAKTQALDVTSSTNSMPSASAFPFETTASSNPILESLMKTPVKKRKPRPSKVKPPASTSLPISPINLQNPISMSVPLQPAPGNSGPLQIKEAVPNPRNKKQQQSQYQLPMPLPIPLPPGILNYASLAPNKDLPKPKKQRKPKAPKTTAILDIPSLPQVQTHTPNKTHPMIPYLPSHLEAFFHPLPTLNGCNSNETSLPQMDQALDLCVKQSPSMPVIQQPKKIKKAKAASTKSLLKPLNVEDDVPLNLVMSRGSTLQVPTTIRKSDTLQPSPVVVEVPVKAQGNLENVKNMLARLHTKIAPAVNGVQLITIE